MLLKTLSWVAFLHLKKQYVFFYIILLLKNKHFFFWQSAKLRKLPPFLTVSLLRFNFDFVKCERYKETSCYTFPLRINLKPFCEQVWTLLFESLSFPLSRVALLDLIFGWLSADSLTLGTVHTSTRSFFAVVGCPVCCRMLNSMPGLCLLVGRSLSHSCPR